MWLFTKYGFFSALCARAGDGSRRQPLDPERIMIRARVREHLQQLRVRFDGFLGECEICEFAGSDYAFRIFVEKNVWCEIISELANEIDYGNFKSEVARYQGAPGAAYEQSLHAVWPVMFKLQNGNRRR